MKRHDALDAEGDLIVSAPRDALLSDKSWIELYKRAGQLILLNDSTAAGVIYMVGAALRAPLTLSLELQIWLASNEETLFKNHPSVCPEVFYPLL